MIVIDPHVDNANYDSPTRKRLIEGIGAIVYAVDIADIDRLTRSVIVGMKDIIGKEFGKLWDGLQKFQLLNRYGEKGEHLCSAIDLDAL